MYNCFMDAQKKTNDRKVDVEEQENYFSNIIALIYHRQFNEQIEARFYFFFNLSSDSIMRFLMRLSFFFSNAADAF